MNREPVRYILRFPDPRTHYLEIEADFPQSGTSGDNGFEIFLPVWTPGSYMIREYSRHIEAVSARDESGRELRVEKTRKNRWRVENGGVARIIVSYRVYCRDMSVRANWVDESFALVNGAPTFVTESNLLGGPYEVLLQLPPQWRSSFSGLAELAPHRYLASNYDELIDSPVYAGNPAVYRFEIGGVPHILVNDGEAGVWDGPRSAADVERIVRSIIEFWGGAIPYRKYIFLNLLTESGGGLEHGNSCCLMASRWGTRTRPGYLRWLHLVSHEFFHAWNVKRLRPAELGPFDYEVENTTRLLWVAEGITEYYGVLLVRRAGLSTLEEYLGTGKEAARDSLSDLIHMLQTTPGRLTHPVAEASFDAWIKLYRPDENLKNTSISYYIKGAVIAWLLDARIRAATADNKSLDDVMRAAFARFSGDRGFTSEQFEALASDLAGLDLGEFFAAALHTTAELDFSIALDWFGLRFHGADENDGKPWMGVETRVDGGRLLVTRVVRGGPAEASGLSTEDEILAVDNFRVRPDKIEKHLENYSVGDRVSILFARRDKLERCELTLGAQQRKWRLQIREDATAEQKQHLAHWLRSGGTPKSSRGSA